MTSSMYQYKSQQQQETPGQVVTIGNVDVVHKNAEAIPLNGGGNLVINLAVFNGPILVWPNPGEQWIVKIVKGQWVLAERTYISAQAYLVDAAPGDQVWDVQGNGTIQVTGNLNISDNNGVLTTNPVPVWTPVTYENSWSDYGSGAPVVQFVASGNSVYFRGGMKPGTTTDGTLAFTIPSQYSPPVAYHFFPVASISGTPATSGLRVMVNTGGNVTIYGVGSSVGVDVSSVHYFYKY
jgi:hypothetical protein